MIALNKPGKRTILVDEPLEPMLDNMKMTDTEKAKWDEYNEKRKDGFIKFIKSRGLTTITVGPSQKRQRGYYVPVTHTGPVSFSFHEEVKRRYPNVIISTVDQKSTFFLPYEFHKKWWLPRQGDVTIILVIASLMLISWAMIMSNTNEARYDTGYDEL
jgi:hypothetical protein